MEGLPCKRHFVYMILNSHNDLYYALQMSKLRPRGVKQVPTGPQPVWRRAYCFVFQSGFKVRAKEVQVRYQVP